MSDAATTPEVQGQTEEGSPPTQDIHIMSNGVDLTEKGDAPEGGSTEAEESQEDDQEPTEIDPQQTVDETEAQINDAKQTLATADLDYDAFQKEYMETGELSAESFEKLEKAGISKSLVQAYVSGLEAQNNAVVDTVVKELGGQEAFTRLGAFVKSLGDKEVDNFNSVVQSNNVQQIVTVLKGYQAQMVSKYGTSNPTILGGASTATPVVGFTSLSEQNKAINDPRYDRDPKYRAEVRQKILTSKF